MIDKLHGKIININENEVNFLVNSIEFLINIPSSSKLKINENIILETFLNFNSESGFTLYGFITIAEKELFKMLITCSGIGPKMALNILNSLNCSIIIDAILQNKAKLLTQVSGIGLKKAELIILSLKGIIEKKRHLFNSIELNSKIKNIDDLIQALTHLGYSNAEVNNGINEVMKMPDIENIEFVDLVRLTLNKI